MLKILFLINHAGKAGTEKYVRNLIEYYHNKRAICLFAYNEGGLLAEQMEEEGIKSFRFDMHHPFDLAAARKLAKICKAEGIDIIHTQYPRENYIAVLARLFGSPAEVVYTCHLTLIPGPAWTLTNSVITRFNKKIIAVCNYSKEILIKAGVNGDKITVIFNGVVPAEGEPVRSKAIRGELGIGEDTFVITTLARYQEEKGLEFLVNSMAELKRRSKRKFCCLIVGDGALYEDIKQKIAEEGLGEEVLQLGFRRDTDSILAGSDVFVNSAKSNEALSFAILEGMEHGLPIIATDIGGNPDIVNEKTGVGILVPYNNPEKMADAVIKLMEDNDFYKECSQNSLKAVREVFNLEKLMDVTFEQYK